ncbi:MAG: hypothetical protein WC389_14325 [Lutibacter sp.]|jgi:hypothetical protein
MPIPFLEQNKPTIEELEEQDQEEELKLSIAQKQALRQKLEANGLKVGTFGSLSKAWEWFRTH